MSDHGPGGRRSDRDGRDAGDEVAGADGGNRAPGGIDDVAANGADDPWRTPGVLRTTARRLREDPRLLLPFAVAGVFVALLDAARRRDPIPETTLPSLGETTVHVQYTPYPAGTAQTFRELGALVDLRLPYLLYAVGLELLAFCALAVAGWLVLARALDVDAEVGALARYAAFVLGLEVALRLFGAVLGHDVSLPLLLAIPAFAALAYLAVRLFVVPAALIDGASFRRALASSDDATYGQRWSVLGVVLLVGVAAWLLGNVPAIGGFLAPAAVAPVHAVAIAVVYERAGSPAADRIVLDHTGTEAGVHES